MPSADYDNNSNWMESWLEIKINVMSIAWIREKFHYTVTIILPSHTEDSNMKSELNFPDYLTVDHADHKEQLRAWH